jgi:hypothetical protein
MGGRVPGVVIHGTWVDGTGESCVLVIVRIGGHVIPGVGNSVTIAELGADVLFESFESEMVPVPFEYPRAAVFCIEPSAHAVYANVTVNVIVTVWPAGMAPPGRKVAIIGAS